jgi:hypothetical protein
MQLADIRDLKSRFLWVRVPPALLREWCNRPQRIHLGIRDSLDTFKVTATLVLAQMVPALMRALCGLRNLIRVRVPAPAL